MSKLEILFGFIIGYIAWAIMFSTKVVFILLGTFVLPIPVIVCHYLEVERLPFIFWPWRNRESGYHNRGFGEDYHNPLARTGGDATIFRRMVAQGKSYLYIALNWSIIRNPANELTRRLGCYIKDVKKRVFSFTSFQKHDGKLVTVTKDGKEYEQRVSWLWSPFPERIRATIGTDWYFDIQLVKTKWMYYPMLRAIKCHKPRVYKTTKWKFFQKADKRYKGIKRLLYWRVWERNSIRRYGAKHTEIIIGFKTYAWMVEYGMNDNWLWMDKDSARPAAFNFVHRFDEDWA